MGVTYNPYSLTGKTILVTGASSGIGRTTAIECSKLGAKVIITARNEERLNETLSSLEGNDHFAIVADLTKQEDIDNLVANLPVLDGVVFNAGIANTKPINFIKSEDIFRIFQTNTFAPMLLNKAIIKGKRYEKNASIVFTSSIAALTNANGNALYSASKAAVSSYMRSCARELADKKVRANAVLPGMVATKLISGGSISDEELARDEATYPLKRYGQPEDIAWAIIFLLSDASSWITGLNLIIDGGKLMR